MPLTDDQAVARALELMEVRASEADDLTVIRKYYLGEPELTWLPHSVPNEVRRLALMSRVPLARLVVNSHTQALYVEGYRSPSDEDEAPAWDVWQRNQMDSRQIGIHRASLTYGVSHGVVLPGNPVPVIRGVSPRNMTTVYGMDDEWPVAALERRAGRWILYDETHAYVLVTDDSTADGYRVEATIPHNAGVAPVVQYRDTDDLDSGFSGLVKPLIPLIDQINVTTFGLQVAQHYGAFRQRYILGWIAEDEETKLKASASKLWTFEDHPNDVEVGEFGQTQLSGYIDSREATIRHLSAVSQTPAHELMGQIANLSAEALVAAEAGFRRATEEHQTVMGESHEQLLRLASFYQGETPDPGAFVRWRDTEARSLSATADALGKLADQLGVPRQELWELIPGVSQQQIERWKSAAQEGDAFAQLGAILERQASGPTQTEV